MIMIWPVPLGAGLSTVPEIDMYYRINWKLATREVRLESAANAAPALLAGYTDLGSFKHGPGKTDDTQAQLPGMQVYPENHVLYHHVQEALYHVGVQDMQTVEILLDGVRSLTIGSGNLNVAVGATSPALTVTVTPENASKEVVWTSSNKAVATVDAAGKVTGVSAGNAVITAKSVGDASISATRNVVVA